MSLSQLRFLSWPLVLSVLLTVAHPFLAAEFCQAAAPLNCANAQSHRGLPPQLYGYYEDFKTDRMDSMTDNVRSEIWTKYYPYRSNQDGIVYRAMTVTADELKNILATGMSPKQTEGSGGRGFKDIFTSDYVDGAFRYLYVGFYRGLDENRAAILLHQQMYPILFELNRNHAQVTSREIEGRQVLLSHVYPDQILRLFFVDPLSKNKDFPFQEYSAQQVMDLLR